MMMAYDVTFLTTGGKAGVVSTAAFTNTTAGSRYVAPNGTWLHSPVAALFGNAGPYGNGAMLLSLRSPVYDFSVQVWCLLIPGSSTSLLCDQ